MLNCEHQYASSYYPQGNGKLEVVNKIIKTMLQWTIGNHKNKWHRMFFSSLWSYCMPTKTANGFTPFHFVNEVESVIPIECYIPSLHLAKEILLYTLSLEEDLLLLEQINEDRRVSLQAIEATKTSSKSHFDSHVHPCTFSEGDLVQRHVRKIKF